MTNHEGNRKAKNELKFLHQIEGVKKEKDGSILWIGGSLAEGFTLEFFFKWWVGYLSAKF